MQVRRPLARFIVPALAAIAVTTVPAASQNPLLFQHGGRPTAQAGAFVARADQPVGMSYNPAAIAWLEGSRVQLGLDFTAPEESYRNAAGEISSQHVITHVPAFYFSQKLPEEYYPLAFGLGLDTRTWHFVDFRPALFPGRFLTRRQELTTLDLHAVIAYEIDEHWSVGAGLHYLYGTQAEGTNRFLDLTVDGRPHRVEVERLAEADVDGTGLDLGFQYRTADAGWGLSLDSGVELEGRGGLDLDPRDVPPDPALAAELDRLLAGGRARLGFDLPWQASMGSWYRVAPAWIAELDLVYSGWSQLDRTAVTYRPDPFGGTDAATEERRRDWQDTLSVRLGSEFQVGPSWLLSAGLAWEPTPVPQATLEPGFPRGDARVLAFGFSYLHQRVSIDVGYSFHDYDDRGAAGQELLDPEARGHYGARNQVWSFSLSWGG